VPHVHPAKAAAPNSRSRSLMVVRACFLISSGRRIRTWTATERPRGDYFRFRLNCMQVRQQIRFVISRKHVAIGRHPIPSVVDLEQNVRVVHRLTVGQCLMLNKCCNEGPIFRSGISTLWQTAHCSNTCFPLEASAFPPFGPAANATAVNSTLNKSRTLGLINRIVISQI